MTPIQRIWRSRRAYADAALYWSGAAWLFESLVQPSGAVILMYHSVAADDVARFIDPPNHLRCTEFERQMAFLNQHRSVVSMSNLVAQLSAGVEPPAGTVCITFDDGYLDNLTVAAPILARYQLPATLYLPTAYIDRAQTHWADAVFQSIEFRTKNLLEIPSLGVLADLSIDGQRMMTIRRLHDPLLEMSYADREQLLTNVQDQLKPQGVFPRLTMNWDDVRKLAEEYPLFEVGGHSCDHIDLRTHCGSSALDEIVRCRTDLRRELGKMPVHFSFPYGRWSVTTRDMVVQNGWDSALGSSGDLRIGANTDRFVMSRAETPKSMTELKFMTSGAFPQIYKILGK